MPHSSASHHEHTHHSLENDLPLKRDPTQTHAYLVGGGIASLSAAVTLIQDALVPASQIHILESSSLPGGSMDGAGDPTSGYVIRGGRMLNSSYVCLYDMLSTIPSLTNPDKSVMREIDEFNNKTANQTHARARLVASTHKGPEIVDSTNFGLGKYDKIDLLRMTVESEGALGTKRINDFFDEDFFKTNFWFMWATTFAFQPWHSAVEFRRYLHRFIHEFPRINTLAGVDRTPFNQFDSIIRPITQYLETEGVRFQFDTRVTGLAYAPTEATTISGIHTSTTSNSMSTTTTTTTTTPATPPTMDTVTIPVNPTDIVIITLGSMTAASTLGTNTTPPAPEMHLPAALTAPDGAWALWSSLSQDQKPHFGNPTPFYTRTAESTWESFTITLSTPDFLHTLARRTHNAPGTGALITFKDSAWLLSIVVPHQPHFPTQPDNIHVVWGYALLPSHIGNHVQKPMSACTGAEITTELLAHLDFPPEPILAHSLTIPCMMPYITSQFLTRTHDDRPQVIPPGSTNLAFVGQFVEIPDDVVFTVEYSVRGAQMAVFGLMRLGRQPKRVYKGERHVEVLAEGLKTLLFGAQGGGEGR